MANGSVKTQTKITSMDQWFHGEEVAHGDAIIQPVILSRAGMQGSRVIGLGSVMSKKMEKTGRIKRLGGSLKA